MRNWNKGPHPDPEARAGVFSVPMRNWNFFSEKMFIKNLGVFSVPMRNWNLPPYFALSWSANVFSVPMRNWNTDVERVKKIYARFLAYLWGIETVHLSCGENWCSQFLAYLWGIETPPSPGGFSAPGLVFSVPMRNWNSPASPHKP